MKKLIAIAMLTLVAACAQTGTSDTMGGNGSGCQKMMESGKQCPITKDGKMKCCCQKTMKEGMGKKSAPSTKSSDVHQQHSAQ